MKNLLFLFLCILSISNLRAEFDCSESAIKAAKSLEAISFQKKYENVKVLSSKLLGKQPIITGYLLKYETVIENSTEELNSYYQTYFYPETCVIKESIKVEPFIYN